ncbi:MAG: S-layer homology domain-containing protein [Chloroflexi bacterium]|nr:S-layer homology domain-containing protein [Chloroflexota bacterium]
MVKLEAANFAGNSIVRVTITNPNTQPLRILKWMIPTDGTEAPLFTVTRNGKTVAYIGRLVKRVASTEADYILLAGGERIVRDVDLSAYYDLSAPGNYEVEYNASSPDLYAGANTAQIANARLGSNRLTLSIKTGVNHNVQKIIPFVVTGTNGFFGCSPDQQGALITARNSASTYAANAVAYFAADKQGARYVTWFGVYDAGRYTTASNHFTAVQNAVDTASPMNFDCTCADPGVYAYVYPDSPYDIYLCGAFWGAPNTGTDSKAGTLIHEITHFNIVAGTDDFVYGQTGAKALAISNPANAVMNADNHEYFAENNPPLEVTNTTFSDVPETYWAWDYIERLYDAGITGGCASNPLRYCPEASVTRAQMAIFILRGIHGSTYTPPAATGTIFSDVPASHWAAAWIERLAAEGITGGCGGTSYCPEANITRAQMAFFLLRSIYGSAYTPPPASGAIFTDVPSSYWAAAWIEQLAADGITGGCGGGNYCPDANVTRAQMAVFLVNTFNLP